MSARHRWGGRWEFGGGGLGAGVNGFCVMWGPARREGLIVARCFDRFSESVPCIYGLSTRLDYDSSSLTSQKPHKLFIQRYAMESAYLLPSWYPSVRTLRREHAMSSCMAQP